MRAGLVGFGVGSLALIALYVGLQPNSAEAATVGGNALVAGLRRMLSADVAGIPQRGGPAASAGSSLVGQVTQSVTAVSQVTQSVVPSIQRVYQQAAAAAGGGAG